MADDLRIGAEARLPRLVADDGNRRVAFVQVKQAAESGNVDPAMTGPGATGNSDTPTAPPAPPDE